MQKPAIPSNELERMAAVRSYDILDTDPEPAFDALTTLAAYIAEVPISLVTILDADRQWFKSRYGLDAPETPRDVSFCGHVVAMEAPLLVNDSFADERFADNPLVTGGPRVVFYAGVPLKTPDGFVVGTLCTIDHQPRQISPQQMDMLALLGQQVVDQLELRRRNTLLRTQAQELEAVLAQTAGLTSRLQSILDSAHHAILEMTPDGILRVFNPAAERMLGVDAAEIVNRVSPCQFFDAYELAARAKKLSLELSSDVEAGVGAIVTKANRGQVDEQEWTWIDKQGHRFPVQVLTTARRDETGELTGYLCIANDISERKRNDRMQAEFISTVSHELRTPLTSIRGALGLLAGGVLGELPQEAEEFLGIAVSNADRLVRLINDILDMEKMQSDSVELRLKTLSLHQALQKAVTANLGFAAQHQVNLELAEDLPRGDVVADEDRLEQVISNLISNAVKYSPKQGVVSLRLIRKKDTLRVEVCDQGPGIPEEFRSRIFQRFAQADTTTTRQKGGSGLGLSISKAIVEKMHGSIGFELPHAGGTLFYFELPCLEPIGDCVGGSELNLALICEDDPHVSRLIARSVASAGFVPHISPTLERARTLLAKNQYRLITLDFGLADGDSRTLISEIRSSATHAQVPIVVISGTSSGEGDSDLAALAVADIIQKPFDHLRLQASLQIALHGSEQAIPSLLYVEDDLDVRQIISRLLPAHWDVTTVDSLSLAREQLRSRSFDVVLLDLSLPDGRGAELLDAVGQASVVIFSAQEVSQDLSDQVALALTKTRTSEEELGRKLIGLVARYQKK
jgi:PAS domain S-box-containing protein